MEEKAKNEGASRAPSPSHLADARKTAGWPLDKDLTGPAEQAKNPVWKHFRKLRQDKSSQTKASRDVFCMLCAAEGHFERGRLAGQVRDCQPGCIPHFPCI